MFRFIVNMPIAYRLLLASALAATIPGIVIFVLGSSYIGTLSTINQTVQTSNDAIKLATDQQADLLRMNALTTALTTTDAKAVRITIPISREINSLSNDFDAKLDTYQKDYQIASSDRMKGLHDVLNGSGLGMQTPISQRSMVFIVSEQWRNYAQAQRTVLQDLEKQNGGTRLANDLAQTNLLYLPLKGNLDNLVGLTESISQIVARQNEQQITPIIWGTVSAFLFSTIAVFLIGYALNLTITAPLRQLTRLTRRIGRGEMDARATLTGNNEITLVATSMNSMLDNIVRLMQETQAQRDLLQARIEAFIDEVRGVGEGDLSLQVHVSSDIFGILAKSFNYMIRELSSLVVRVKSVSNEVDKLTATTLECMQLLVSVSEHQIQQTATSEQEVQYISNLTRQMAERSRTLSKIANETRLTARDGRVAVQQTIEGMGRINENVLTTSGKVQLLGENSREINDVVKVITSIAYHTNRLALDAAIQASMAGANGKGFEVLALDIRALAEQTKKQANLIASIVSNINENISKAADAMRDTERETDRGTELARQAGTALGSIFEDVERQAKEIEDISMLADNQLKSSRVAVQVMQAVSEAARGSSATTKEASQNMWELTQLVARLRTSVAAFKLRDQNYAPRRIQSTGSNPQHKAVYNLDRTNVPQTH
ncbi:MAG: hypothetical protein PVS3B1_02070 [Ktedonobacteraceae bacterium]